MTGHGFQSLWPGDCDLLSLSSKSAISLLVELAAIRQILQRCHHPVPFFRDGQQRALPQQESVSKQRPLQLATRLKTFLVLLGPLQCPQKNKKGSGLLRSSLPRECSVPFGKTLELSPRWKDSINVCICVLDLATGPAQCSAGHPSLCAC